MVSEAKREYNQKWVEKNQDKIKEYREKTKDRRNERRRELYARDEYRRIQARKNTKEYRKKNPTNKRNNDLMAKYGITYAEYVSLLKSQGGGCAICGRTQNLDSKFSLHVDHDHDTGNIRGILCSSCNLGLGKFNHDRDRLNAAVSYLEVHNHG